MKNTSLMPVFDIYGLCDKELIYSLSTAFGPTGCESIVASAIYNEIKDDCDKIGFDRLNNLIGKISLGKSENPKRVMLCAHMDEVGFMIEEVCESGMLTFATLGGIDSSVLAGKNVVVYNGDKIIRGVICSKAIHHKSRRERSEAVDSDKLHIDIGATSREDAEELVSVGDFATFDSTSPPLAFFGKDKNTMRCKALDDRMGCAALIEIIRRLRREKPDLELDIYFCFTVCEETGHSGALVAAERISPDYALVLESTAVGDIPSAPDNKRVAELSHGAVISIADRATIYDRELIDLAFALAREKEIPLQVKRYLSGGNDAGNVHKSGKGVRSLAISVPTRYLHSASCVAHYNDYLSMRDISYALLCELGKS